MGANALNFREWLEERGCLGKYARNRMEALHDHDDWYFSVDETDVDNYINRAFYWSTTPEDHSFWEKIHWEWRGECRAHYWNVEAGMPFNDQLGLTLLSMEDGDDEA